MSYLPPSSYQTTPEYELTLVSRSGVLTIEIRHPGENRVVYAWNVPKKPVVSLRGEALKNHLDEIAPKYPKLFASKDTLANLRRTMGIDFSQRLERKP